MTTVPSTVSPGQVITAAQSNSYRTAIVELQADRLLKAGGTMTGPLLLPTTQNLGSTAAIHKGYADTTYLNAAGTAGDTMAGPLILPSTQSTNPLSAIHRTFADATYVNVAGDTLTGPLLLDSPQSTNAAAAIRKDYADATYINDAGDTMTGALEFGGGGGPGFSGQKVDTTGHTDSTVSANQSNLALNKISSGVVAAGNYVLFQKGTSGGSTATTIGSIQMDTDLASVNFNQTSDGRLKDDLGPLVDPAGVIAALRPKHLRWKDSGVEFDGFIAQEVQAVIPSAVTGAADAVDDDGAIVPQQLALMKMIPYLVGAIQTLTARVATLEAAAA